MGGCVFVRRTSVLRRRGDRFFPGTLFQDRLRRPAAGEAGIIMFRCITLIEVWFGFTIELGWKILGNSAMR